LECLNGVFKEVFDEVSRGLHGKFIRGGKSNN
jgi:hypothetical protein